MILEHVLHLTCQLIVAQVPVVEDNPKQDLVLQIIKRLNLSFFCDGYAYSTLSETNRGKKKNFILLMSLMC